MIRCVAFDLDGVVIPVQPSFSFFEREYGITEQDFSEFFRGHYIPAMRGEIDLFEVLPEFLAKWRWRGTTEEFANVWMGSAADADPAARAVVEQVRAMRVLCYAASNQDNRRAAFLKNLPWLQAIFDETFFSCDLGVMKPDARYFAIIERHAKLPPEQLLFVDDRLENVEGARQCGWAAEVCNGAVDLRRIMDRYLFNPGKQGACE